MKKIVFVTPPDAQFGFSLAGVRQLTAEGDAVKRVLLDSTSDPSVGVVVVDERLVGESIQQHLSDIEREWSGVIVILPAPEAAERPAEEYAMRIIREAIGYQVRLNL